MHCIMETARLNQPIFYDYLCFKMDIIGVLLWERGYAIISTENVRVSICSGLIGTMFDYERTP